MEPTETTIKAQLDQLAELQSRRDLLALNKQALIDSLLSPEVKAQLADIEAEFSEQFEAIDARVAEAQEQIKADVQAQGKTIRGARLQAVWIKGRIVWNSEAIDGYAMEHPELFVFRNEGKPSVALRQIKG